MVTAPAAKTIPIRTPFTLTGSATDADAGDTLTYLWEQTDPGGLTGTGLVDNDKRDGPLFRQFGVAANVSATDTLLYHSPGENLAGTSPSRTFPDLAQVLAGNTNAKTGTCPAAPAAPASGGGTNVPAATIDCYSEFLPTGGWVGNPPRAAGAALPADGARRVHPRRGRPTTPAGCPPTTSRSPSTPERGPVPGHLAGQQRSRVRRWRR